MKAVTRIAAGSAAAAAVIFASGSPMAGAGPVTGSLQSNFWWEAESSATPLPAPPEVPSGGLWVSSNPTGPQAISALRFQLADGYTNPVVTLRVASATPAGPLPLVACRAITAWKEGKGPSNWADRPGSDCQSGSVTAAADPSGATMSFALQPLLSSGSVDVVFEPAPPAPGATFPTFDVTFQPVDEASVTADAPSPAASPVPSASSPAIGSSGSVPTGTPSGAAAPAASALPTGGDNLGPTGTSPTPAGTVSPAAAAPAPGPGLSPLPPNGTAAPTTAPGPASGGGEPVTNQPSALAGPVSHLAVVTGRSWQERILLAVVVVDLALYLVWSRRRPSGPARHRAVPFGAVAGPPARLGKPPALR